MQKFEQSLVRDIRSAVLKLGYPDETVVLALAKPEIPADVYTTIACQLASQHRKDTAHNIAYRLAELLKANPYVASIAPEKNGFLNIRLSDRAFTECYSDLLEPQVPSKSKSWKYLEIISANPTGYLHIGHARHGILTDTLGNIFEKEGYLVRREYLVNNDGNQIKELVRSFWYLWRKELNLLTSEERNEEPQLSYTGPDIIECVRHLIPKFRHLWFNAQTPDPQHYKAIRTEVINYFLGKIKELTDQYHIKVDFWRYESVFVNEDSLNRIIRMMGDRISYEQGAVWMDISDSRCEEPKKEVMVKSDGHHTYFAQDTIYHDLKLGLIGERDEIVDVLGCDHYGHAEKLMGYIKARGHGEEKRIKIIWMQLVKLLSDGKAITMSKRDSTVVYMKDLEQYMTYEEVRWFFVSQSSTTTLEIDVEKLKTKDYNNPVYYVMYAYSRISNIIKKEKSVDFRNPDLTFDRLTDQERNIFNHLLHFDAILRSAAETYSPHKLPQYLLKLAQLFHPYYETTKILDTEKDLLPQRLALLEAVRLTIKEGLQIMKIEAREKL